MNVARMLDIPRDLEGAAAIVATGEVRTIDVGEAKGQIFFEGGSVGLNAAVFREAQQADSDSGATGRCGRPLGASPLPAPRMVLHLDDRVLTTRALAVAVANGPYAGLGFTVAPDAAIDDGKFDVVIFSRFSRTELIRHFVSIAFGRRRYIGEDCHLSHLAGPHRGRASASLPRGRTRPGVHTGGVRGAPGRIARRRAAASHVAALPLRMCIWPYG